MSQTMGSIGETQHSNISYFEIAGFNIKVSVTPQKRKMGSYPYELQPRELLKGFIIRKPKKIDFEIFLLRSQNVVTYTKHNTNFKSVFLYFYQIEDTSIKTFNHISSAQFFFIMSLVINQLLAKNNGFMVHASAVRNDGEETLLFLGSSGAGKSTIVKMLSKDFKPIADDSLIVRKIHGKYIGYQTFYVEKNNIGLKKKGGHTISHIFFLKQAKKTKATLLTNKSHIIAKLLPQITHQLHGSSKKILFQQCRNISNNFNSFYELSFSLKQKEVVDTINEYLDA